MAEPLPAALMRFVSDLTPAGRFGESELVFTGTEILALERGHVRARWPAAAPVIQERRGYVVLLTADGAELARCTAAKLPELAAFRAAVAGTAFAGEGPLPADPATRRGTRAFRRLVGEVAPLSTEVALACALVVAAAAVGLAPPALAKKLVDEVLRPGASAAALARVVGLMALVTAATHAVGHARRRVEARLRGLLAHRLRAQAFEAAARFSLGDASRATPNALAQTIMGDSGQVVGLLNGILLPALYHGLLVAGILASLAWMSPWLALLVLVPAPLVALAVRRVSSGGQLLVTRTWTEQMMLSQRVSSFLNGFRVVKAFAAEHAQAAAFRAHSESVRARETDLELHYGAYAPLLSLVTGAGSLIIWGAGGWLVLRGSLGVGSLVAYVAYLSMIYAHAQSLSHLAAALPRAWSAARQYLEILDVVPSVRAPATPVRLERPSGALKLERVSFSYVPGREVLHDIDLAIEAGEFVGLVGRSGAGKSTLVNLIARLHDPTSGRVLLDGIPLDRIDSADLCHAIAMVLQIPFLFAGTVLENLLVGRPDATLRDVCESADRAQAHDFILSLPDGYDTRLGDRVALSAGEQQRLTIARALLRDPRVLILDEATSSLDAETERAIQDALAELTRGRTTIAIAHRASTLARAHRLVRLDAGRVVDVATASGAVAASPWRGLAWRTPEPADTGLVPVRAFPDTAPDHHVALRPRGAPTIAMIEDPGTAYHAALATEELSPRIQAIHALTHEDGWYHWTVDTDLGPRQFRTRQTWSEPPATQTRSGAVIIRGADGVRYTVPGLDALDQRSRFLLGELL